MEKAIQTFEGLIRRSIAPSVTFFVIMATVDLALLEYTGGSAAVRSKKCIRFLAETFEESGGVFTVIVGLLILGVSYALMTVQQVLFDNRLKADFDPGPRWKWPSKLMSLSWLCGLRASAEGERRALVELRGRVLDRLGTAPDLVGHRGLKESSDYMLYEILGGIDTIDTRPFVDSAKAMGITCISAMLALFWGAIAYWKPLGWWELVALAVLFVIAYWLGREAILAQYRARALRLYVNFLMMPVERIRHRLLWPLGESKHSNGAEGGD